MTNDPAKRQENIQAADKPVIMIVDDSRLMRHAIKKILSEEYHLIEAEDGEDGWEKLSANPAIQVVFTDLSMPGLDGFGLLARIRESDDEKLSELPVIVITGNEDDVEIKEKALKNGATDFITKPFQSVQIKARAKAHATNRLKLQAADAELEQKTKVDALTGLGNHIEFTNRGNEAISFAIRHKSELVLALLEIDDYAGIVASHGQNIGDVVVKRVGEILSEHVRREDTLTRMHDGRFGLMLPATNLVGAKHLAKRMLEDINTRPLRAGEVTLKLTASIGIEAAVIKHGVTLEDLQKTAETRLALAQSAGGNYHVCDGKAETAALEDAVKWAAEQEARRQAEIEARKQAEEAARRAEEEARKQAEEAARRAEEEARKQAEEAARRAEEEARKQAEEAARRAEEEARQQAEEAARRAEEEARQQAEEAEAERRRAEEEARKQAEEAEAERHRAEEEARKQAEEAEAERRRAEEEAAWKAAIADAEKLEQEESLARERETAEREADAARIRANIEAKLANVEAVEKTPSSGKLLRACMPLLNGLGKILGKRYSAWLSRLKSRL